MLARCVGVSQLLHSDPELPADTGLPGPASQSAVARAGVVLQVVFGICCTLSIAVMTADDCECSAGFAVWRQSSCSDRLEKGACFKVPIKEENLHH